MKPYVHYSSELADRICALMQERDERGTPRTIRGISEMPDMPSEASIYGWLHKHPEFFEKYTRAREAQAHMVAADIIEITDTEDDPAKARVRMDARKWFASKLHNKGYGDVTTNVHQDPDGKPITPVINVTVGRDQPEPAS